MKDKRFNRRLVDAVTMFIVTALSFLLLVYVGYGEGRRTYEQFHVEKLIGHGSVVQNAMENYLRAGLPLDQYAGFTALAEPMVKIQDIDALAVYDQTGRQLFVVADKAQPALKLPEPSAAIKNVTDKIETDYGGTHYQVIVPLRTRFETVGSLVVTSPTEIVTNHLDKSFQWVLYPLIGLSLAFAIAVFIASPYMARVRTPWLQIGYAVIFLTMAGVVVGTLISVYAEGVQSKTRAAAVTLSQRLNDIVEFNLRLREFDGLERTFADYRRLNPEISEAALINEGVVQIATDPTKVGKPWMSESRTYEHFVELTPPNTPRRIIVAVAVPKDIIYRQIESSVRNFAALFVASGFMAGLFLQVASSMQRLRFSSSDRDQSALGGATALIIVKPIFFLAVFLEHLTYSFLPKFMQDAALASGMSAAFASAPFTAYYLCFALSLIPAGHFADRYGPRPVIWGGMVLASATLFCLIFPLGILPITAIRGLSGIGQGMLFIGIQSYILAVASPEKKTQGAAIIVFGFQGGMISGMAIGSLLVTYLQPEGVFVISGAIGAAMAVYSLMLIPREVVVTPTERGLGMTLHQVASDLKEVIHSGEFLRTMFCIGVPAKAILTGTITFALPLLLGQQGYRHEEIGQILMLYGIGVVAASAYISRLVDRTGNTEAVLFWGAALSGVGLVLIGLMGSSAVGNGLLSTSAVVAGVVLVGIAHGFINAPVIAHVAQLELAGRIGVNPVTTTYRFLERIGHVAGPFLVGQLFLVWGQSPHIIGWIGIATATLGLLFIVHNNPPRVSEMGPEAAR
jgi:MFS family permease